MDNVIQYVSELSESVWGQTLGMTLIPSTSAVPPGGDGGTVQGHVHISGEWQGTLVLQCSTALAREAAVRMFGEDCSGDTLQDMQDAVGELTNMIGGNIKALVSTDGCYLSLPMVIEGRDYSVRTSGTKVLTRQVFASEGEPVIVTLLQAA